MMLKFILAGAALMLVAAALFVRLNPLETKALHIDPETAERPGVPGHVLVRPGGDIEPKIYPMTPAELAARFEAIILSTAGTERVAGKLDGGFATYVTRSTLWGFPDIANVKVLPDEGGASLRILSRLHYGHYDMGVNQKRVEGWLAAL